MPEQSPTNRPARASGEVLVSWQDDAEQLVQKVRLAARRQGTDRVCETQPAADEGLGGPLLLCATEEEPPEERAMLKWVFHHERLHEDAQRLQQGSEFLGAAVDLLAQRGLG